MKLALAFALLLAAPALAEDVVSPTITVTASDGITARQRAVPRQLTDEQRAQYSAIFTALGNGRTSEANRLLEAMPAGLLHDAARAELLLARGVGNTPRADLAAWLETARDLPQAPRIADAAARLPGADAAPLPLLPDARPFRVASTGWTPPGPNDNVFAARLKPLLEAERPADAEAAWWQGQAMASPASAAEWGQKTAWRYYVANDDVAAERMGLAAASLSHWKAADAAFTAGLAAFRQGRFADAARAFDLIAGKGAKDDITAAGAFWAGRAWGMVGDMAARNNRWQVAAKVQNSFYGLLAAQSLASVGAGQLPALDWREPDFISADWNYLKALPGAQRAAALAEIGQLGLADKELRYLAQIAPADAYPAIMRLAARLQLPATQYSLAIKPPVGLEAPLSARYPAPDWVPARGWRVPRALVFAHALQESAFATTATSRTGAKGLMQLMPDTSKLMMQRLARSDAGAAALVVGDLTDPSFNIELGQGYLELLGNMGITQGLLPKVIASYNAGPGNVKRWADSVNDQGDALLFIESIPFSETRHYTEIVIRNLWMYQLREGETPATLVAMAQGLWPRFPGLPGPAGVKIAARPFTPPLAPSPLPLSVDDEVTIGDTGK